MHLRRIFNAFTAAKDELNPSEKTLSSPLRIFSIDYKLYLLAA